MAWITAAAAALGLLGSLAQSAKGPAPPPMAPRSGTSAPFVPSAVHFQGLRAPESPSPMLRLTDVLGPPPSSRRDLDELLRLSDLLGGM